MRRIVVLLALGVGAAVGGCGSTSCNDACQSLVGCLNRLNPITNQLDVPTCTAQCQAGTCANKQIFIDCVNGAQCTTADAYDTALSNCQAQTGCSFQ